MALYKWQEEAIKRARHTDQLALLAEMGTGKTCAMIHILKEHKEHELLAGNKIKIIIFTPAVTIFNWKEEFTKFAPDLFYVEALDAKERKKFSFDSTAEVVVTNLEALQDKAFTKNLKVWAPMVMVIDEMHRIKNYQSKRAKEAVAIGDMTTYRYGLTGTAILNSPQDIYMQWRYLDKGQSFGKSFFSFRAKYFTNANAHKPWLTFPDWQPIKDKYPIMQNIIYNNAIRVKKEECLDLPPLVEKVIKLKLTSQQAKMYKQMKNDFLAVVGEDSRAVADIALTKGLRLMQICSGHLKDDKGETHVFETPKLSATMSLLEDIEGKVIVWCSFKQDISALAEAMDKNKIIFTTLTGEQSTKEKQEAIELFQKDTSVKVMLANRKAGGIGVNLTAANYSIIYSRNFSLEDELQSDARNYRGGSEIHDKIVKINLVIEDTIDEHLLSAIKQKDITASKIIDIIRRY